MTKIYENILIVNKPTNNKKRLYSMRILKHFFISESLFVTGEKPGEKTHNIPLSGCISTNVFGLIWEIVL